MNTAAVMSERDLQAAIVTYARLSGWMVFHTYDSRRCEPGYPDLHMVKGRRSVFAELKTEKGALSAAQAVWLSALQDAGQEVFVFRPADWLGGLVEHVLRGSPA